jgi:hypothetical protein
MHAQVLGEIGLVFEELEHPVQSFTVAHERTWVDVHKLVGVNKNARYNRDAPLGQVHGNSNGDANLDDHLLMGQRPISPTA